MHSTITSEGKAIVLKQQNRKTILACLFYQRQRSRYFNAIVIRYFALAKTLILDPLAHFFVENAMAQDMNTNKSNVFVLFALAIVRKHMPSKIFKK